MSRLFDKIINRTTEILAYCSEGVWTDTRRTFKVNVIKTVNLTIRSFLDRNLQSTACSLSYRLLLALVPILALLFAIGRGFGFQNLLTTQLFNYFPAQQQALETAFRFVDSYLAQTSEGIFVGIGLLFLLWTLISLTGSVEDAFNRIWGVRTGRSWFRKITDYTAIYMILPILMICSSGISVFMSSTLQDAIALPFMTPIISMLFDFASVALTWLFFTGVYMLLPNTKVKFSNALVSGILAGIAYQFLQWLFVTGQLYVTKYNAIYGGFAFLPLLLIWLQLVWLITLAGAVLCYSSQNIMTFLFASDINDISCHYRRCVAVAIMTVVAQRFQRDMPPMTTSDMESSFGFPVRLLNDIISDLEKNNLINRIITTDSDNVSNAAIQPARNIDSMTVGYVMEVLDTHGSTKFIPEFSERFASVEAAVAAVDSAMHHNAGLTKLTDLKLEDLGSTSPTTTKQIKHNKTDLQ